MKGPCDGKWLPLTPSVPGGRGPDQTEGALPKDAEIGKRWAIFAAVRLPAVRM